MCVCIYMMIQFHGLWEPLPSQSPPPTDFPVDIITTYPHLENVNKAVLTGNFVSMLMSRN